jgi:hypothetical protein
MKREDDQPLWDLLGRSARPDVSPFFSRNVLRRVRQEPRWLITARNWFGWRRLVPVAGASIVLLGAVVMIQHPSEHEAIAINEQPDPLVAKIDVQDYEVVADLDNLLASDENNLWDDTSSL